MRKFTNNKNKRNNRRPRNNQSKHNAQNLDQQQNLMSTRGTEKIRNIKLSNKYFYNYGTGITMTNSASQIFLADPVQGTQSDQRIGDKIVVRKIEMKYSISVSTDDAYNEVRLLIVYSPNPSSTIPQILDNFGGTGTPHPLSFTKPFSTGTNFIVLFDQTHILNVQSSNANVHNEICVRPNLPSTWDYPQNFESGRFSLILLGDSGFVPHPYITFNIRTTYSDL